MKLFRFETQSIASLRSSFSKVFNSNFYTYISILKYLNYHINLIKMEETKVPAAPASVLCNCCFKHINESDSFCDSCGYPLMGTDQEQRYFISVRNSREIDLDDANNKIKKAGYVLYYIAGATVIMGLIAYTTTKDKETAQFTLITNVILAVIYAGLGLWSNRKPLAVIISGFSLYVLILVLNAVVSPLTIVSGIFFKIIVIGFFIRGVKSAIDAEKIKKELNIE
jgi:hypothetical protein